MRFFSAFSDLRGRAEQASSALPGLMIAAEKLADTILHGDHARRKAGAGEKFWQYREYTPSDRPQDIDWRQSAKGDAVFVKQTEWQITRKNYFWCARGASMDFNSKASYARTLTLAIAILLHRSHEQIGVFGETRCGRSEAMIETIGHAILENDDNYLPQNTAHNLPKNAYFIGIGDFLAPIEETENCFANLAERTENALILQILDPAEINLEFSGRTRFMNKNNTEDHLINHIPSVRDAYQSRINAHCRAVHDLCLGHGWRYKLCCTDENLNNALNTLYAMLNEETL